MLKAAKQAMRGVVGAERWDALHAGWTRAAHRWYGKPSEHMVVVGVTGTNGKSSTCLLLARMCEAGGWRVGMSSGLVLKEGEREWMNPEHMTMPGRHYLHQRLWRMRKKGCNLAIVETTSEGIKQGRHAGVAYDIAVFTNLSAEHLQSHGSFEQYRREKGKLFAALSCTPRKEGAQLASLPPPSFSQRYSSVPKVSVVNSDDAEAHFFLSFPADERVQYGLCGREQRGVSVRGQRFCADHITYRHDGTSFSVDGTVFHSPLLGEINVYNALAALSAARVLGVSDEDIQKGLSSVRVIPGRMEFIENDRGITFIVEHAHTPDAYISLFSFLRSLYPQNRIIAIFGSAGGNRDREKRPQLGRIAAQYCQALFLTEEDPYDTPPEEILDDIERGAHLFLEENPDRKVVIQRVPDRFQAICSAVKEARKGDVVLLLGKGAEPTLVRKEGAVPWDDRQKAREALKIT